MDAGEFSGSVAKLVVRMLTDFGVPAVFGIPGIQNLELYDEMADAPFRVVCPTDERAAAFMADGFGRVTGKPGVLILIGGPGLTNALTGIAEAFLDSSPMLVFVTSGQAGIQKSFQLHEIPQQEITRRLAKSFSQPKALAEVAEAVYDAMNIATAGEPGPAVIEIPSDLWITTGRCMLRRPQATPPPSPDPVAVQRITDALLDSRIGIYAGAGAIDAAAEITQLAELLQAPIATTISGRGLVPEDHPLSVGYGFGPSGSTVAQSSFGKVKTLLAVGCKYGEVATGAYSLRVPEDHIHIDINPASIGRNYATRLSLVADAKTALQAILADVSRRITPSPEPTRAAIAALRTAERESQIARAISQQHVTPAEVFRTLRTLMDRRDILVTDSGNHQFWAFSDYAVYCARTFLTPTDFQAMGFSVPCAIGAQLAAPERRVVSIVGDGGFLMSGFECLTAVRLGLPITVIVFCDGEWGLISEAQQRGYRRRVSTTLKNPDYELLARSFGMTHIRISSDAELEAGLRKALCAAEPCLVRVDVRYTESSRYVKGSAREMLRRLPRGSQARAIFRWTSRFFVPPEKRRS